jgi:hypothetical protein
MPWQPKTAVPADAWKPTTGTLLGSNANRNPIADVPIMGAGGATVGGLTEAAPQILGALGSLAPGTIPGATVGGLLGGAIQQGGRAALGLPGAPQSFGQATRNVERSAVGQGIAAAGGKAFNAATSFAGNRIMAGALKANPEIAQTALEEGIGATQRGFNKLMNKIGDTGAAVRTLASRATNTMGAPFVPRDMANNALQAMTSKPEGLAFGTGEVQQLSNMAGRFQKNYPSNLTPNQLLEIVRKYDGEAESVYAARAAKDYIPPAQELKAKFAKAIADEGRAQLASLPPDPTGVTLPNGQKVATISDAQAYASKLQKLKAVMPQAAKKGIPVSSNVLTRGAVVAGGATAGAMMGHGSPMERAAHGAEFGAGMYMAGSPQVASLISLLMSNPALARAILLGSQTAGPLAQGQQ